MSNRIKIYTVVVEDRLAESPVDQPYGSHISASYRSIDKAIIAADRIIADLGMAGNVQQDSEGCVVRSVTIAVNTLYD